MKHTLEEKLAAIKMVEDGNSVRAVSDKFHLGHHQLFDWLAIYKEKGETGLANHRNCEKIQFSFEEKCKIVREYQESELTLPEIGAKHGISSGTLWTWINKVSRGGMDALKRKQTYKNAPVKVRMKRLPKEEYEKENERLRKENERLRAEVLLLKKVRALVEEREAQNRRIGRGPSKS